MHRNLRELCLPTTDLRTDSVCLLLIYMSLCALSNVFLHCQSNLPWFIRFYDIFVQYTYKSNIPIPTFSFMDASQCLLVGLVLARSNLVEILHFISCTLDAF